MNKNLNYNYENRSVSRTTSVLANVEMVSCKKADLSRLKVTNGNFYHTTDTNEFFYDWGGKRNKLNVLGGDQNIQSEIDKIKEDVAKLDTKKMDSLETKVNTAVQTVNGVKSDVADAVKRANEASKTAQDAANAVTDKASKRDIDEAIAKIDLTGYAKKSEIPSLDNYATKDEIPSLDNYATKDELPSVEGFIKSGDLVDYAKKSDIPNPLVKSVDDSEATQTKVQFGVDETGKLTGSIAAYDVDGVVQSKINDLNLDSKYAPAGSLDGKQDKLSDDQLAALDKVNTLNLDGKQDTLANADVLSKITAEEVTAWNGKQDTLANASVLSNITAEQVNAWNGKQDTITTVTLPTASISDDWDGELATLDQDGYVKANDLIKYVEAAIMKKKSDESAVVTEKNSYAYITGYSEGDKETDITVDNPFKLNPEGETEIVFLTANEIGTFDADHPGDDITEPIKPVINVPTGYTLTSMYMYNDAGKKWDQVTTVCPNSRYATKTINGIVYNSYTRSNSSDMAAIGAAKYKITITKD